MAKVRGTIDRPYWSAIVVDGDAVKLRLTAERQFAKTPVHVDWCRFTVIRRNAPAPSVDFLFPFAKGMLKDTCGHVELENWQKHQAGRYVENRLPVQDVSQEEFAAAAEAFEIAGSICAALGEHFRVFPEPLKGMDFYKYRWSIQMNEQECAWVGFLGCSSSPRQSAQDKTIHVNLQGMACTFAESGWRDRIADICEDLEGTLTRCDLALDFFDGFEGGIQKVWDQYRDGVCNVNGRKLKFNIVGDWENNNNRSIYIGSRESGKVTNVYEKGDQLYGEKYGSEWIRAELRYGNQDRVLSVDMLRRPADFFAGASDWHALLLDMADFSVIPQEAPTTPRLELETIEGEAVRYTRHLVQNAGPALAAAVQFLSGADLWEAIKGARLPGRLKKFSSAQLEKHIPVAFKKYACSVAVAPFTLGEEKVFADRSGSTFGVVAVGSSPAFA